MLPCKWTCPKLTWSPFPIYIYPGLGVIIYGTVESRRYAVLFVNSVAPPPSRVRDARRALLALWGRGAQKITRGNSGCIAAARPRLAGLETPLMPTWLRAWIVYNAYAYLIQSLVGVKLAVSLQVGLKHVLPSFIQAHRSQPSRFRRDCTELHYYVPPSRFTNLLSRFHRFGRDVL